MNADSNYRGNPAAEHPEVEGREAEAVDVPWWAYQGAGEDPATHPVVCDCLLCIPGA